MGFGHIFFINLGSLLTFLWKYYGSTLETPPATAFSLSFLVGRNPTKMQKEPTQTHLGFESILFRGAVGEAPAQQSEQLSAEHWI